MGKKPVIQFENFRFQYFSQAAPTLHDINLTIYEGEKFIMSILKVSRIVRRLLQALLHIFMNIPEISSHLFQVKCLQQYNQKNRYGIVMLFRI